MSPNGISAQNVLAILSSMTQEDATLKIYKSFRGTILHLDARILAITPSGIVLQSPDIRIAFTSGSFIYLNSKQLPMPVMARLCDINLFNNTLFVTDLTYKEDGWKERSQERVHPKEPTYAMLHWNRKTIQTTVENISCQGMGLLTYKLFEKGFRIQPSSEILLDIQIPPDYRLNGLRGTVIYQCLLGEAFVRIGVQLHPNLSQRHLIEQYVASLKGEIMSELDQIYNDVLNEPDVVDQFF